jgi:hypothetical protein
MLLLASVLLWQLMFLLGIKYSKFAMNLVLNKYPLISENIDPMYKFSLPWFVKIYHREERAMKKSRHMQNFKGVKSQDELGLKCQSISKNLRIFGTS